MVFTISSSGKSDYLKQAADVQGIQISSSEQILTITLSGLLPKRKVRTNTAFLHEPLNLALQTYILEHPIQLYQNCVVCFSQIYDQNLSLHRVRALGAHRRPAVDVTGPDGALDELVDRARGRVEDERDLRGVLVGHEELRRWGRDAAQR